MIKRFLTPKQVEEIYSIKVGTLANWRTQGKGPNYIKAGGKILYPVTKFEAWLDRNQILTSDQG